MMTHEGPREVTIHDERKAVRVRAWLTDGADGGGSGGRTHSRPRILLPQRRRLLRGGIPPQPSRRRRNRCFGPAVAAQGAVHSGLRGGGLRAVCARSCSRRPQGGLEYLFWHLYFVVFIGGENLLGTGADCVQATLGLMTGDGKQCHMLDARIDEDAPLVLCNVLLVLLKGNLSNGASCSEPMVFIDALDSFLR